MGNELPSLHRRGPPLLPDGNGVRDLARLVDKLGVLYLPRLIKLSTKLGEYPNQVSSSPLSPLPLILNWRETYLFAAFRILVITINSFPIIGFHFEEKCSPTTAIGDPQ